MALDGFFFDVEAFFASMGVQRMSFSEAGVYLVLLFQEWREPTRNLPDDVEAIVDLIALTEAKADEVRAAWPKVRAKFVSDRRHEARIYNVRLEKTRRQQAANLRKRSSDARAAGKASAAKRQREHDLTVNGRSTGVEQSSTVEKSLVEKRSNRRKNPPTPLADAKGANPRITRALRKRIEEIRRMNFGCRHEPRCQNTEACIQAMAAELAVSA